MLLFSSFAKRLVEKFSRQTTSSKRVKMEVTSKNFAEKLALVESSIDSATFMTFDGEFTGLVQDEHNRHSALDTAAERYSKVRDSANRFLLVQFGLCTFHYDEKKDRFTNRVFNFYVWPKPYSRSAPDTRFTCQTSSLDFLASQNFDFNKLIREGVPYLRPCDEARIRESIQEKQTNRRLSNNLFQTPKGTGASGVTPNTSSNGGGGGNYMDVVPDDRKEMIETALAKVEAWLEDAERKEPLELDKCNAFERRLLYQTVKPKFLEKHSFHMETVVKEKSERVIVLTKVNEEEIRKLEQERNDSEFVEVESAVGFAKVVRKMSQSKKLLVGHNMLLDLCHTLQQFVAPLPTDYEDFKLLAVSTFPNMIDTKLLASTSPLKEDIPNSALEELLKIVQASPFELPPVAQGDNDHPGYEIGETSEKYHEAGYDAFITGLCFIAQLKRLASIRDATASTKKISSTPSKKFDMDLVEPFANKLHLMRTLDLPYMNLGGADLVPVRDHVFHVTFPAEWKTTDLYQLFSPFGSVAVSWLSDTTAYVSLREQVANAKMVVMSTINCSSIYSIVPYEQHKKMEAMYSSTSLINNTGITPMMEKTSLFTTTLIQNQPKSKLSTWKSPPPDSSTTAKKRHASPEREAYKRTKSVSDDSSTNTTKTFDEPPWD